MRVRILKPGDQGLEDSGEQGTIQGYVSVAHEIIAVVKRDSGVFEPISVKLLKEAVNEQRPNGCVDATPGAINVID